MYSIYIRILVLLTRRLNKKCQMKPDLSAYCIRLLLVIHWTDKISHKEQKSNLHPECKPIHKLGANSFHTYYSPQIPVFVLLRKGGAECRRVNSLAGDEKEKWKSFAWKLNKCPGWNHKSKTWNEHILVCILKHSVYVMLCVYRNLLPTSISLSCSSQHPLLPLSFFTTYISKHTVLFSITCKNNDKLFTRTPSSIFKIFFFIETME